MAVSGDLLVGVSLGGKVGDASFGGGEGVEGLRVADASIAPTLVRGHTAALATAIGERAADLIRGASAPRSVKAATVLGTST